MLALLTTAHSYAHAKHIPLFKEFPPTIIA